VNFKSLELTQIRPSLLSLFFSFQIILNDPGPMFLTHVSTTSLLVAATRTATRFPRSNLTSPLRSFSSQLYHYWVELLLGAWKSYSHLDPTITPAGVSKLPPPARIIFPHAFEDQWRDKTGLNAWLTKMAFPGSESLSFPFSKLAVELTLILFWMILQWLLSSRAIGTIGPSAG